MAKYYKTKQPTGLTFTRKKNVIRLDWKAGDSDYKRGQQIAWNYWQWKYKYDKKKKKKVGYSAKVGSNGFRWLNVNSRSYNFTVNLNSYYPYKETRLTLISVSVRGCRATFSGYNTQMSNQATKQYKVLEPSPPNVSASFSSDYNNQTEFTWSCPDSGTTTRIFTDYERETMLVENCNVTDGKKVSWTNASKYTGASTTHTVTEGTVFSGNYSYTRWYRVRCRGPRGASDWRYARHVYAMPAYATDVKAVVSAKDVGRGQYRVDVRWVADATVAHPIDSTTVEYLVTKPTSHLSDIVAADGTVTKHVTLTPPPMTGSTSVSVTKDTEGEDGIVFSVPTLSENDNCVVVRVNTKHDNNVGTGFTTYVDNSFGKLSNPVISSIGTVDVQTRRVTISIENKSDVSNTHIAIFYKDAAAVGDVQHPCVGIMTSEQSSITIMLPESCLTSPFSLGVQARLGDYSPTEYLSSDPTIFTLSNAIMQSEIVWSAGSIPQAPQKVTLTTPSVGTVRVSWDWSWKDATGAELSWADHEDAWESTDEPTTYTVHNSSASAWNISGLNIGTWYVRVRLFKTTTDGTMYGSYSNIESIKLASVPAIPSLTLSEYVVPKNESVTCYWAYTTTDGTYQDHAEICEAISIEGGGYTYGDIIGRTSTNQYLTLYPEDLGWNYGETHYLAVRVTSSSGETSGGWSTPVSLAIADKVAIEIRNSSLVDKREIIGGEDSYVLTDDQEVVPSKTYYTRSGEGTEQDPYIYTEVTNPASNPAEAGYYELNILEYKALTKMPLTIDVFKGDGSSDPLEGEVLIVIERAETYLIVRPDDSEIDGFEKETIALISKSLDGPISIERDDLMGLFDDGSKYNIIASITDSYGRTSETEPLLFKVEWDHQAVVPSAEVEVFSDDIYATILPVAPVNEYEKTVDTEVVEGKKYYTRSGEGTDEDPYVYTEVASPSGNPQERGYYESYVYTNDRCDIYRLSVDVPELIVENAVFGTKYVDPYPTLKMFGGYRVVYKTVDGDYITPGNNLAWMDYNSPEHQIDRFLTIIDFGDDRVILPYDLDVSNSWSKDFTETKYLGGSVQGDWNPAVSRTGSVNSTTIVEEDPETIQAMRRLATYAGICRIRTPEGSNYAANIEVKENREARKVNEVVKFSIDITRVDDVNLDGVEYDAWIRDEV